MQNQLPVTRSGSIAISVQAGGITKSAILPRNTINPYMVAQSSRGVAGYPGETWDLPPVHTGTNDTADSVERQVQLMEEKH